MSMLEFLQDENQISFIEILTQASYILEAAMHKGALHFKLTLKQVHMIPKTYVGQINKISQYESLEKLCDNLEDMFEAMRDKRYVHVDLGDAVVVLRIPEGLKKDKYSELARVSLKQLEIQDGYVKQFEGYMDRCFSKNDLANYEVKELIGFLMGQVLQIRKQLKQQNNEIKRNRKSSIIINDKQHKIEYKIQKNVDTINKSIEEQIIKLKNLIIESEQNLKIYFEQQISQKMQKFSSLQNHKRMNNKSSTTQNIDDLKFLPNLQNSLSKSKSKQGSQKKVNSQIQLTEFHSTISDDFTVRSKADSQFSQIRRQSQRFTGNIIPSSQWIDKQCFYYNKVKFQQNKIISLFGYSDIICSKILKGNFFFTVKFQAIKFDVSIGISDSWYKKQQFLAEQQYNGIYYHSDGSLWKNGINEGAQGIGFQQGDQVTVCGNLIKGEIEWSVNGDVRGSCKWKKLKDDKTKWVPWVCLRGVGDCISLIQ